MTYINLKISGKNGKIYESSKEPKDGFEKVLYGENNDNVTYHKYYNSIQGKFVGFGLSEMKSDKANIMMLNVKIDNADDKYTIAVPLKTTYGGITDTAKSIVSAFIGANANEDYSVSAYIKLNTKDGKEYKNYNVFVNSLTNLDDNGKGVSTGFIPFSEIPRAEREDDGMGGVTYNNKPVNAFFGAKIREIEAKFATNSTEAPAPQQSQEPKKVTTTSKLAPVEDDDDLPF